MNEEIISILFLVCYNQSKEVPCWLFLMWVSQMLAILDKPEAPAVHAILEDLTSQYPQVRYS